MVYTKGSRFGVFSGHTVRRPEFSYSQLCADQHIVVQSNKPFNRGIQVVNDIQLSMNKKNRWKMTDNLIDEMNVPDSMIIISHHHLKPSQHRKAADCVHVCSQKNGKTQLRDAKSTYARAEDLCDDTEDRVVEDDAEAQHMPTKRQKRRRKGNKKVQEQDEEDLYEELLIHCKVYTAPSKHHFQVQPPRGSYSSKSSKTRKGLPGGNVSYFQDMYDDEVWDEYEDVMMKEAVEDSLDGLRSNDWVHNTLDNSLEDFILPPAKKTNKSQRKKGGCQKKATDGITCKETKDHIIYVDKDEVAIPHSHLMASYVPAPRGWVKKKRGKRRNKSEKILDQSTEVPSTFKSDEPSFIVPSMGCDDIKDLQISASRNFNGSTFHCSKCHPPRLAVDITPYILDKLRQGGFVNTIKAMAEVKKKYWIVVDSNGMEPQQCDINQGKQSIRLTLVGFPRDMDIETETRDHLIHLHHCSTDRVMKILKEHFDKLTLERFFTSTPFPYGKPEIKLDVLGELWEWKQETKSPLQLITESDVEDDVSRNLEEYFVEPLKDSVTECGICLERDVSEPDGVTVGATALTDCQHWFCNNCWRNYLKAEINRGETRLTCPAFDCKTSVDDITVASLVPASYQQFKEQQREVLGISQQLIVCPRNACDHFLPMAPEVSGATKSSPGLLCACGHVFCSRCRKRLHWPSTCEQNEMYKEDFPKKVEYFKKCTIRHVNFRRCPACSRPLEKYTGCNFVTCRCSYSFCWVCGVTLKSHYHPRVCKPSNLEIVFADVIRLSSNFDRAIIHHKKGSKVAADARRIQANKLMSKMIPVIRGSPWLPCSQPTPQTKRSNTLVLDRTVSVQFLSQVFGDAVDICNETEFVLENLEIFLSSRSILDQSKRKLVTEIKGRLGYTSNQIQKILEEKSHSDLLAIPERLLNLARLGRQNLHKLAITLK